MDAPFPPGMVEEIEKFFAEDSFRQPGLDYYEAVFRTQLFFPLQRKAELAWMMQIARKVCPTTVMEIGADKGGGLYHWCKCLLSVRRVIGCEIRGTPYQSEFAKAFSQINFVWMERGSLPPPAIVRDPLLANHKIDVLFIDGDKNRFLEDFDAYRPLMSNHGVVFMHDINEHGSPMRRAFDTVAARGYPHAVVIDTTESAEAKMRELDGIPASNPHEGWLRHWNGRSCGVGAIWMREGLK